MDMELAWHLLTVLVRLGRPAAASELASAAALSVSPDLVERMCRIPGSPLRISGGGVVTASETAVLAFLRFAGLDVPAPRVSLRPPEVRKWSGKVTIRYERKRKMPDVNCFSTKRRRLLAPDSGGLISQRSQIVPFTCFYCICAGSGGLSLFLYLFGFILCRFDGTQRA